MPSAPAFQFYPDDFLGSGTVGMGTLEEIGAYTLLLCLDWNSNGFSLNFDRLARWCKITPRKFKHLWGYLESHFPECEDGLRRNPRLQLERVKQAEYSQAMSENGKKGGRPKKPAALPQESDGLAAVKPNGKPPESTPSPSPSPLTTKDQLPPSHDGFGTSPNGGNGSGPHTPIPDPPGSSPKTKGARKTSVPPNWVARCSQIWSEAGRGAIPEKKLGGQLVQAVRVFGEERVERAWRRFAVSSSSRYGASYFAEHLGDFEPKLYGIGGTLTDEEIAEISR